MVLKLSVKENFLQEHDAPKHTGYGILYMKVYAIKAAGEPYMLRIFRTETAARQAVSILHDELHLDGVYYVEEEEVEE